MSEITREDIRDLKESIGKRFDSLEEKIGDHIKDDQKVALQVAVIDNKVGSLSGGSKVLIQWALGLVAVAIAGAVGFLFRSSIDVQVARPVQQYLPQPQQQAHP